VFVSLLGILRFNRGGTGIKSSTERGELRGGQERIDKNRSLLARPPIRPRPSEYKRKGGDIVEVRSKRGGTRRQRLQTMLPPQAGSLTYQVRRKGSVGVRLCGK